MDTFERGAYTILAAIWGVLVVYCACLAMAIKRYGWPCEPESCAMASLLGKPVPEGWREEDEQDGWRLYRQRTQVEHGVWDAAVETKNEIVVGVEHRFTSARTFLLNRYQYKGKQRGRFLPTSPAP